MGVYFKTMSRVAIILSLVFLNISCDQLSKRIVRIKIQTNERIQVIQDTLILTKVENSGAAYSFGSNWHPIVKRIVLQVIPAIVLLVLLVLTLTKAEYPKVVIVGFSFVIGGGIGNVFDRIAYGSVTDFMYVDLGFFATEIFNMADVSIVIGALIVLTHTLLHKKKTNDLEESIE
jgi:signal peptidase II